MFIFRLLGSAFLLPGTIVLGLFDISEEQDGGVFRSLVNMIFWGFICVLITLPLIMKMTAYTP